MGDTTLRPVSIAPLAELTGLRTLSLIGPVTDVRALTSLTRLEELSLRSVTLSDLSVLLPRRRLLIGMRRLGADSLRPLIGHPTLRRGIWRQQPEEHRGPRPAAAGIAPYGHPAAAGSEAAQSPGGNDPG